VYSETGHLEKVIVHTPGHEVSLVNPEMKDELLFDDIIFEEDAKMEHRDMLKVFQAAMPENGEIFEITDLAIQTMSDKNARSFFIDRLIHELPHENLHVLEDQLMEYPPEKLIEFIIEGSGTSAKGFTLLPAPNLLFTRDLAAVVGNQIILSRAAKKARVREFVLMDTIVSFHPIFKEAQMQSLRIHGSQTLEGGDVIVASEKVVLIGMSERTSFTGLMAVTETLLSSGVEHIIAIDIPKKRSSMHLDTIFTFADRGECIVFPPDIEELTNNIVVLSKDDDKIIAHSETTLKDTLEELLGYPITFIRCGGEDRTNQFREQWTDGANVFALAPGVIIGYERNTKTFNSLIDHGYRYMNQYEFIEEYQDKPFHPESEGKMAITFQGHELCRGRGGARCMTLPILRSN
ncbi:MAG: arginine deiminase family protein, partial [Balneolaceae bacterium]